MKVRRIVANIEAGSLGAAKSFYGEVLGLAVVMQHDFIVTYGADDPAPVQVSIATGGGSGTAVPDLSIEVDDLATVHRRLIEREFPIEYGPIVEPWGVRRLYTRDPYGRLINILEHS